MCVVAMLCLLYRKGSAQNIEVVPFQIGERVPDLPLKNIINSKDSISTLSGFGNKLIILDFWDTHCTTCIRMFPLEDSLQVMFRNVIQFLLVTSDSDETVADFLQKYKIKQGKPLLLPILANDSLFKNLFAFTYIPHYVWIAPNGKILAQSSHSMVSRQTIESLTSWIDADYKRARSYNLPESHFVFPGLTPDSRKKLLQFNN